MNPYQYATDQPLTVADPTGLSPQPGSSLFTTSTIMDVVDFGVDAFGELGGGPKDRDQRLQGG